MSRSYDQQDLGKILQNIFWNEPVARVNARSGRINVVNDLRDQELDPEYHPMAQGSPEDYARYARMQQGVVDGLSLMHKMDAYRSLCRARRIAAAYEKREMDYAADAWAEYEGGTDGD